MFSNVLCAGSPILVASLSSPYSSPGQQESWDDARVLVTPEAIYNAHLDTAQLVLVRCLVFRHACSEG